MSDELKPCPFCGGTPTWRLTKKKYCQLHGDEYQHHILGCQKCHCPIKPMVIGNIEDHLIKAWNTRTGERTKNKHLEEIIKNSKEVRINNEVSDIINCTDFAMSKYRKIKELFKRR